MNGRTAIALAAFAAAVCAGTARAQDFHFSVNGREFGGARQARGGKLFRPALKAKLVPARTIVAGEPFAIEFSLTLPRGASFEDIETAGIPGAEDGVQLLRQENLPDGDAGGEDGVEKRFRLVMRGTRPVSVNRRIVIAGRVKSREPLRIAGSRGSSFSNVNGDVSYGTVLQMSVDGVSVDIEPLPEAGKPAEFSGAVGSRFVLRSEFEKPQEGWPGTWSTAVYTLEYDGWFPSNAVPRVYGFEKTFEKVHPLRETARSAQTAEWRQTMMPRGTSCTNGPAASLVYYNTKTRRYETVRCAGAPLAFKRPPPPPEPPPEIGIAGDGTRGGKTLHFAPSARSPAIGVVPAGETPQTLDRKGAWRRVRTSAGTGWMK